MEKTRKIVVCIPLTRVLVVHDPKRVRVQVAAKLSDDAFGESPDHLQVPAAVFVLERGSLVGIPLVGSRAHVTHQVHLRKQESSTCKYSAVACICNESVG